MYTFIITLRTLHYHVLHSCFLAWNLSSWREEVLFAMVFLCLASTLPVVVAQNTFIEIAT